MNIYYVTFYFGTPEKVRANNIEDIYRWFPGNVKQIQFLYKEKL